MRYFKIFGFSILLLCAAIVAQAQETDGHPALDITRAKNLFEAGNKDKAVYWYYVAQLRFRIHLTARPEEAGDKVLLGTLSDAVGKPINEWAFGDPEAFAETLDDVIDWHLKNDDDFTPKANFGDAHQSNIDGIKGLRNEIAGSVEIIRQQRSANGLENR